MEQNQTDDHVHLSISVSTDRDHFLRRTCPSCGLDFKTEIDPGELQWTLGQYCRRVGLDIGEQADQPDTPKLIRCPYCAHEDQCRQMHTAETVEYLKRIVQRELVYPVMNKFLSGLGDGFGGARNSGGMLSISIEFNYSRSIRPVRPIHGPEPGDLKIVTFLCCGKSVKILDSWNDVRACSFCGAEVALV